MKFKQYVVDAFATKRFEGNPAAVVPLEEWLEEEVMQSIAAENNLSETAFLVPLEDGYQIRWFTPVTEVKLCGHATLASAHVLAKEMNIASDELRFESLSGPLRVELGDDSYILDFPAEPMQPVSQPIGLQDALGCEVQECYFGTDLMVIVEDEITLSTLEPNFFLLSQVDARGVIVSSESNSYDFVSRFFAPQVGIDEDPVTGSAFTKLIPYWSEHLQKQEMRAKQISARGGEVLCTMNGERVLIGGTAVTFSRGEISI